jgi:uncharacterized protein with NRDE domain
MCLCLFAINESDEFPFILIANRDEYRKRAAAKADFWEDEPNVLAGRDLEGMGTWLGTNTDGKIAFLTNYRHPDFFNRKGPTRGKLVSNFLISDVDGESYLKGIEKPEAHNGFNLVVGTSKKLFFYSNVENEIKPIDSGIHGLSNAFLDTSWPKVDDGKSKLQAAIESDALDIDNLFSILHDSSFAKEEDLPQTGVGPEFEKLLSAKFINTPDYGTVCSTVIKINRKGHCFFEERTFDAKGKKVFSVDFVIPFHN